MSWPSCEGSQQCHSNLTWWNLEETHGVFGGSCGACLPQRPQSRGETLLLKPLPGGTQPSAMQQPARISVAQVQLFDSYPGVPRPRRANGAVLRVGGAPQTPPSTPMGSLRVFILRWKISTSDTVFKSKVLGLRKSSKHSEQNSYTPTKVISSLLTRVPAIMDRFSSLGLEQLSGRGQNECVGEDKSLCLGRSKPHECG